MCLKTLYLGASQKKLSLELMRDNIVIIYNISEALHNVQPLVTAS